MLGRLRWTARRRVSLTGDSKYKTVRGRQNGGEGFGEEGAFSCGIRVYYEDVVEHLAIPPQHELLSASLLGTIAQSM